MGAIENYLYKQISKEQLKRMKRELIDKADLHMLVDNMIKGSALISLHDRPLVDSWIEMFEKLLEGE